MKDDAVVVGLDPLVALAVPDDRTAIAEVVGQGVDDLVVEELEQLVARVDQVHLDPQVAEHRGVFAADHAGAVDGDRLRRMVEVEDRVAVEDARMAEVDVRRAIGARAGGEDEGVGPQLRRPPCWSQTSIVCGIDEAGLPAENGYAVAHRKTPAAFRPAVR